MRVGRRECGREGFCYREGYLQVHPSANDFEGQAQEDSSNLWCKTRLDESVSKSQSRQQPGVSALPSRERLLSVPCPYRDGGVATSQVKKFFEENPLPNNTRKLSQMLESMAINVRFFKTIAASPLSTASFWEGIRI